MNEKYCHRRHDGSAALVPSSSPRRPWLRDDKEKCYGVVKAGRTTAPPRADPAPAPPRWMPRGMPFVVVPKAARRSSLGPLQPAEAACHGVAPAIMGPIY